MSLHPLKHISGSSLPGNPKKRTEGIGRFSTRTSAYLSIGAVLVVVTVESEHELWVVDPHLHPDPLGAVKEVYDTDERGWITQVSLLTATSGRYPPCPYDKYGVNTKNSFNTPPS